MPTVVLRTFQTQGADGADDRLALPALELGRFLAVGARYARPLVPPFFRSARAVSMALAPMAWTWSRTSNSVLPSSWRSGFEASSRATASRSCSAVCLGMAHMRWASASCSADKCGFEDMGDSFIKDQFPDRSHRHSADPKFPPTLQLLTLDGTRAT